MLTGTEIKCIQLTGSITMKSERCGIEIECPLPPAVDVLMLLVWSRHKMKLVIQADHILVLVSPLYCRVVAGKTRSADGGDSVLHARYIHDRMYNEYMTSITNGHSSSRRFVPLVMSGASMSDVPDWLRKSSQPFIWPQQYKHLMFYLIQPAQVIANYVSKRNRAFPFLRS